MRSLNVILDIKVEDASDYKLPEAVAAAVRKLASKPEFINGESMPPFVFEYNYPEHPGFILNKATNALEAQFCKAHSVMVTIETKARNAYQFPDADSLSPEEIESLKAKIFASGGSSLRVIPNRIICKPIVCEQCREEVRTERAECADGKMYCIPCFVETNVLRASSHDPE